MRRKDRPGCGGRTTQNLPRFRTISLSSAVCAAARCRAGAEIQNLLGWLFWSRAVLYNDYSSGCIWDLTCSVSMRLFGGARGFGTENQNLSGFIVWPYLFPEISAVLRAAGQIAQEP